MFYDYVQRCKFEWKLAGKKSFDVLYEKKYFLMLHDEE